jgi:hypothetical protein
MPAYAHMFGGVAGSQLSTALAALCACACRDDDTYSYFGSLPGKADCRLCDARCGQCWDTQLKYESEFCKRARSCDACWGECDGCSRVACSSCVKTFQTCNTCGYQACENCGVSRFKGNCPCEVGPGQGGQQGRACSTSAHALFTVPCRAWCVGRIKPSNAHTNRHAAYE